MKTLIPIDRTTIVRNRNAGSTITFFPGFSSVTFTCDKHYPVLYDESKYTLTSWSSNPDEPVTGTVIVPMDNEILKELKSIKAEISISNNMLEVDHFPIPEYDYEYTNVLLTCSECNRKFMYTELQSEESLDAFSATVCPRCGEWDCVNIKHESIDDVLKEMTEEEKANITYNAKD